MSILSSSVTVLACVVAVMLLVVNLMDDMSNSVNPVVGF